MLIKAMRIGVVGPIWLNIPPRGYGGTEDVVYNLVNNLSQRGHSVTLFGPKTSRVKAKLHPTVDFALRDKNIDWSNISYSLIHITEAFDRADQFDILHVHLNKAQDNIALPLALNSKTPVLFTLHFMLPNNSGPERKDRYAVLKKYSSLPFVSISNAQRKPIKLNYIATVYNGIDLKLFPFSNRKGTYLVWLGKVSPVKGTKDAILAAKKAGIKIYIMGTVDKGVPELLSYYENQVKPLIDDKVIWLGEVSHAEKTSILSGAIAFLNPIHWEEPFGLVMVESLAVGTPVISYARGSAPELIKDGSTGFLVKNMGQMVKKIREAQYLDRGASRRSIEEKFTIEKMVDGYEEAYKHTIGNWKKFREKQKRQLKEDTVK